MSGTRSPAGGRRRSPVRRITAWAAAGSLATAAGLAALIGVGQAGQSSTTEQNTGGTTSDTGTGSGTSSSDGLQQPGQAPSSSSGTGSVTSGGS